MNKIILRNLKKKRCSSHLAFVNDFFNVNPPAYFFPLPNFIFDANSFSFFMLTHTHTHTHTIHRIYYTCLVWHTAYCLQYQLFLNGPPSNYSIESPLLNFSDRFFLRDLTVSHYLLIFTWSDSRLNLCFRRGHPSQNRTDTSLLNFGGVTMITESFIPDEVYIKRIKPLN